MFVERTASSFGEVTLLFYLDDNSTEVSWEYQGYINVERAVIGQFWRF